MKRKNFIIGMTYDLKEDYLKQGFSKEDVAEFDSVSTINSLENAISGLGFKVERIGNINSLYSALAAKKRWDLVFNIAEGVSGVDRESQVPSLLDAHNIPYTFSDPLVSNLTLNKPLAKELIKSAGLPTPSFYVVSNIEEINAINLNYPLFAKPIAEGTGKGIDNKSIISSFPELEEVCSNLLVHFKQPVLVEEFLPGREFTTGILGNKENAFVLGTTEVKFLSNCPSKIYSLEVKENYEKFVKYNCVKESSLLSKIEGLALKSYNVLGCRDAGRVDIKISRDGTPNFIEMNSLPGLHPVHSDLCIIANQSGMNYSKLIEIIIENAISRINNKNN